jgi:hypothetical protein
VSRPKLTDERRREIALRAASGESPMSLAREYGIARSWVYELLNDAVENYTAKLTKAKKELEYREQAAKLARKRRLARNEPTT